METGKYEATVLFNHFFVPAHASNKAIGGAGLSRGNFKDRSGIYLTLPLYHESQKPRIISFLGFENSVCEGRKSNAVMINRFQPLTSRDSPGYYRDPYKKFCLVNFGKVKYNYMKILTN